MTTYNAQTDSRKLRLNLYGPIGENPLLGGGGITSAWVAEQIVNAGKIDQIDVYINSPGGDVFEGVAIYNELKQFPGQVNVFVMGIAASIASIIAMAGEQRVVYDGAEFMIHQASGVTFGTADEHVKQAKTLRRLDKKLAGIYADATGGDAQAIAELMVEETWMEGDEAMADGFATHRSPQEAVAPPQAAMAMLNQFQHVPLKVAVWADQYSGETNEPTTETQAMADEMPPEEEIEEETPEALKAKIAELEDKIQALEEEKPEAVEEEEMPDASEDEEDAPQAIAKAFAHDESFAVAMITKGVSLAEAHVQYTSYAAERLKAAANRAAADADGVEPVAVAVHRGTETDTDTEQVYRRASEMKTDIGRNAYLNDRGVDVGSYNAWFKANH